MRKTNKQIGLTKLSQILFQKEKGRGGEGKDEEGQAWELHQGHKSHVVTSFQDSAKAGGENAVVALFFCVSLVHSAHLCFSDFSGSEEQKH